MLWQPQGSPTLASERQQLNTLALDDVRGSVGRCDHPLEHALALPPMQGCSRSYCANCRALWHEGECAQLGEDIKVSKEDCGSESASYSIPPRCVTGVSRSRQGLDEGILLAPVERSRMHIFSVCICL